MKNKVIVVLREDDWELFGETLALDSNSGAFEKPLRRDLSVALSRVEVFKKEAYDKDKETRVFIAVEASDGETLGVRAFSTKKAAEKFKKCSKAEVSIFERVVMNLNAG